MDEHDETNELAIVGDETADHTVPAEVLVRALRGLQRVVYLMAASSRNQPLGDRFAPSDALRAESTLRCGVPRASSFAVPLLLERRERLMFPAFDPLSAAFEVFRLASEVRWAELASLFSRSTYVNRVLTELREMLPKSGERWGVRLRVGNNRVVLDESVSRSLGAYLSSSSAEDATMTVTGELLRVNIESLRLVIRYPPTRTEISCQCEPSVFDAVIRNYDVPIQVTGLYTLDHKGHPIRLTGVTRVEPVELSPMAFSQVTWGGHSLAIDPPLTLVPTMDEESGQFYLLENPDMGIDVFARTRDELRDELAEQLVFQWEAYALESPDRLSRGARRLRESLLARVREVERAPFSEIR